MTKYKPKVHRESERVAAEDITVQGMVFTFEFTRTIEWQDDPTAYEDVAPNPNEIDVWHDLGEGKLSEWPLQFQVDALTALATWCVAHHPCMERYEPDEEYERAAARARSNDFEDTGGKDWT